MSQNEKASGAGSAPEAKGYDDDDVNRHQYNKANGGGKQAPEIKPETVCGDLHHLPTALASLVNRPHWVLWRWEKPKDKFTKVPYQPSGRRAKNNDPTTWSSYDVVLRADGRFRWHWFLSV